MSQYDVYDAGDFDEIGDISDLNTQQTRCHECQEWFPDDQMRPANDSPEGPWGWGVCFPCYRKQRPITNATPIGGTHDPR